MRFVLVAVAVRLWLLSTLCLWLAYCPPVTQAASWSWSFSSSSKTLEEKEDDSLIVSPIVNRQLETSVKAHHWPTTPQNVFCEAWAFHSASTVPGSNQSNESSDFQYLDRLVDLLDQLYTHTGGVGDPETNQFFRFTRASAREIALQAATRTGTTTERGLLEVALALRSGSPLCETHRGMARQTLVQAGKLNASASVHVFAVVQSMGLLLLPEEMRQFDWTVIGTEQNQHQPTTSMGYLLPGEVPRRYNGSLGFNSTEDFVVLYGNFGTTEFLRTYQRLVTLKVPLVVRFMGAVRYEEDPSLAVPTALQGYGVRLDIRNVEYKVFDDRRDRQKDGDGALNLTAHPEAIPGDLLAGIDLEKLGLQNDLALKQTLWQTHEKQQLQSQKIPPVWQRRQLPLQAATVISQAPDPLSTLAQVSQNLPSLASLLVNVKIPDEMSSAAELMENDQSLIPGRLYINGRAIALESPSFNIFEVLNIFRQEETSLRNLEKTLSPYFDIHALRKIQDAWIQGEAFEMGGAGEGGDDDEEDDDDDIDSMGQRSKDKTIRIDVGRGWKNAVVYLNDVEKDPQYSRWPRSVKGMLQSMQFGMPPVVRRNMFTLLAVMDPVQDAMADMLSLGMQLVQNSYPARIGVLWVNQDDINECRSWLQAQPSLEAEVPCPVKPKFAKKPTRQELDNTKATTQMVHRVLTHVVQEFDYQPQIPLAFAEYLISSLDGFPDLNDLTVKDVVGIFSAMLELMGVPDASSPEDSLRDALVEPSPNYGYALRFAAERNLSPGMGFLNGRPLIGSDSSAISRAFGEEQQHIFELIMSNEITDTSPKSVYAKLLSGEKVFKKVHPLLFAKDTDASSYTVLNHPFDSKSLIFHARNFESAKAVFVAENVMAYSDQKGISQVQTFLAALKDYPSSVDGSGGPVEVSVGYRILPLSKEDVASPLCPLFAQASNLGIDQLLMILERFQQSEQTMSLEQLLELLSVGGGVIDPSACTSVDYLKDAWEPRKLIVVNGRSYEPQEETISSDDLALLFQMEFARAKAIYESLQEYVDVKSPSPDLVQSIGRACAFLGAERSKGSKRTGVIQNLSRIESQGEISGRNPLRFRIPGSTVDEQKLESSVVVVLDPVSDAAQRISSFLLLVRDSLGLSMEVVLSPSTLIDGGSKVPITSYYRFVADTQVLDDKDPVARFSNLPTNHLLTIRMDVPEPWDVQQTSATQDTDNLRCDNIAGCSDKSYASEESGPMHGLQLTSVEYGLSSLLIFGQCYETSSGSPPNGLQLVLTPHAQGTTKGLSEFEIDADGSAHFSDLHAIPRVSRFSDTLVMKTVGYWQLRANAGVWRIKIAEESKGASIFDFVEATVKGGRIKVAKGELSSGREIVVKDFVNRGETVFVQRRAGMEKESLFFDSDAKSKLELSDETIHVFSLATGHLYERFLKIMMLSVTKRTSSKVKFWLFENFLSPTFKATAKAMAERIGCEVAFVTYKWPEWLRGQSEKQRIIWGYKILFLDVLFPLDVKKIIYVDADQVVRGDLKELWNMDLKGAPYGYTPFCSSRESTVGYQFWREGFWKSHLQGKPYHISALYVVDLDLFRRSLVGDQLRAIYQQLSADPNSLANLDQDLPNYAQHQVPIFSLPQEWLWCESWCSDETKINAKTIDLCNNPMHKEPKVSMAKRVISGPLFNESWIELDAEVDMYEKEYFNSLSS